MKHYLRNLGFAPSYAYAPVKTHLSYSLRPVENGLCFQIHEQSADIDAFLAKNQYRASNGMLIAASAFPEFKDSKNTIFLRGSDSRQDGKLDVTRFVSNKARDNKKEMVEEALREFVGYIKTLKPYYAYKAPKVQEEYLIILTGHAA